MTIVMLLQIKPPITFKASNCYSITPLPPIHSTIGICLSLRATHQTGKNGGRIPEKFSCTSSWLKTMFRSTLSCFHAPCWVLGMTTHWWIISVPQVYACIMRVYVILLRKTTILKQILLIIRHYELLYTKR